MIMFLGRYPWRQDAQVAGHAEVDDQRAMRKMQQQILAAPAGALHDLPPQHGRQFGREGPAQAAATQYHALHGAPLQMRRQAAPGDFNFW